jgi:hypothetical protein
MIQKYASSVSVTIPEAMQRLSHELTYQTADQQNLEDPLQAATRL